MAWALAKKRLTVSGRFRLRARGRTAPTWAGRGAEPRAVADLHGRRLSGYLTPDKDGNYTMFIAADDGKKPPSITHRPPSSESAT